MKKNKLDRQVQRNNREKITFTLHPDIVGVIRSIATEEDIPMSVVADEALYAGFKKMGRMDQLPTGESQGPTLIYIKQLFPILSRRFSNSFTF